MVNFQVWVLDTLPGEVRAGSEGRVDHPADLIAALRRLPLPIEGRAVLVDYLVSAGFSRHIAQVRLGRMSPCTAPVDCKSLHTSPGLAVAGWLLPVVLRHSSWRSCWTCPFQLCPFHECSVLTAQWTCTNLRPWDGRSSQLVWSFDLDGIAEMYR